MASISFSGYQDCNTWSSWQTNSITSNRSFGYTRKTGSKEDYRLLLRVTLTAGTNESIDSFSIKLKITASIGTQDPAPSKNFGVEGYLYENESVLKNDLLNPPSGYLSYAAESSPVATTTSARFFTLTFSNVHCTSTSAKQYYIWVGGIASSDRWLMEFWGGSGCSVTVVNTSTLAGTWRKPLSLAWSPTKSSSGYYSGLRGINQNFTITVPTGYYAYGAQDNKTYYRKSNLIYDVQSGMTTARILRYASCNSVDTNSITVDAGLSSVYYSTIYIPRLCFSGFFDKEYCINTMEYLEGNNKITSPSIGGLSGWIFLGYRTSTSAPTSDSVNYTTWTTSAPNNIALYGLLKKTLTFNPNGGTSNGSANPKTYTEYKYGTNNGLLTTGNYNYSASKTGYTLSCWADSDGDEYTNMQDAFNRADNDSILTAIWTPATQTNIINHWAWGFENQEGNNGDRKDAFKLAQTTFSANTDNTITLTENYKTTIPNGFSFNPVMATDNITGTWTGYPLPYSTSQKPNSMSFEYDYIPTVWTITYNLNGGTNYNPSTYTVLYGVTFSNPTKTGYYFSHWTNANGTTITGINPGANATFSSASDLYSKLSNRTIGDQTVTAHWTAKQTDITLNRQGGSGGPSSVTATYDSPMPTITPPTKYGYQFLGYYGNSSGGNQYYKSDGTSYQNWNRDYAAVTLYAQWRDNSSNLILDPQGGINGTSSVTAVQNSPMPTITPPIREGYQFLGYYDSNNIQYYYANGGSFRNWNKTGSQTLYAHWSFQGMHLYQSGWKTIVPYIYFGDIIYEQTTSIANQTTPYQYHIEEAKNNITIIDTEFYSGVSGDPYITEDSSNPTSHSSDFDVSTAGGEVFVDVKAGAKFTIGTYNYTLNWGSNSLSFQIISQASAWKRVLPYVYYNNNWQPIYSIPYSPPAITQQPVSSLQINTGERKSLTCQAIGENLSYQWQVSSSASSGFSNITNTGVARGINYQNYQTKAITIGLGTNQNTITKYYRCQITDGTTTIYTNTTTVNFIKTGSI